MSNEMYHSPADSRDPHGVFKEQGYQIKDTAPPGDYDFEQAFYHSSNTYFFHNGMKAGLRKMLEVAKRFHLGEKTDFPIGEEVAGNVPGPEQAGEDAADDQRALRLHRPGNHSDAPANGGD